MLPRPGSAAVGPGPRPAERRASGGRALRGYSVADAGNPAQAIGMEARKGRDSLARPGTQYDSPARRDRAGLPRIVAGLYARSRFPELLQARTMASVRHPSPTRWVVHLASTVGGRQRSHGMEGTWVRPCSASSRRSPRSGG